MAYFSRGYFRVHARPVPLTLAGAVVEGVPKEFSSGSLGWNFSGTVTIMVAGVPVQCQAGVNLTIKNSKGIQ